MSHPVVTAVAPRWEVALAAALARSGQVTVARRCADVPELLGVAAAGLARVAVVSSDLRGLDRDTLDQLAAHDVAVLGVHPPGDEAAERRLRRWGVRVVLPSDTTTAGLDEGIDQLLAPATAAAAGADGGGVTPGRHRSRRDGPGGETADDAARDLAGGPTGDRSGSADSSRDVRTGGEQAGDGHDGGMLLDGQDDRRSGPRGTIGRHGTRRPDADGDEDISPGGSSQDESLPGPRSGGSSRTVLEEAWPGEGQGRGEVVVVWGPPGSPGRTTVAVNLAAELADPVTRPTVLVDADTYAASVAQVLGVLDEVPGVAAAARVADEGDLDPLRLADLAPEVRPGLRVLTGLPRADRWPEVRDVALADVLETCRSLARWTVVDVAPFLEQDEELAFDTLAPRRNGATLTALETADRVVAVGTGDPVGLQRLVRALDGLAEHCVAERTVVVTRVRPGPVGADPGRRIRDALERFAGIGSVHLVPEDQDALDAALLHGGALVEVRPRSQARTALVDLAGIVAGAPLPHRGRRGASARRAGRAGGEGDESESRAAGGRPPRSWFRRR